MGLFHGTMLSLTTAAVALTCMTMTAQADNGKSKSSSGKLLVYFGSYTKGKAKGIYVYSMNPTTGKLTPESVGPDVDNPSFVAIHPSHKYLYAVNEVGSFDGKVSGAVSAYKIDAKTGALTFINQKPSFGADPCHLTVDPTGKCVIAANYTSGSTVVLPVNADGSLGEPGCVIQHTGDSVDKARQEGPHAHSTVIDPTGKFVFVCDLGADKIIPYRINAEGANVDDSGLTPAKAIPGSGPRHIRFHPNGKIAYVINEMKSTVTAFKYDGATAGLTPFQTISTLPADFKGATTTAEIQISPDAKFLYGSNRGHDSIAIFSISPKDGTLKLVGHESSGGKVPRCFALDPSGSFVIAANQGTDNVVVFKRNKKTGTLKPTGQVLSISKPVCVEFLQMK
jgi:6-phosphogluconolactonase